jgi:hypothetical protein
MMLVYAGFACENEMKDHLQDEKRNNNRCATKGKS